MGRAPQPGGPQRVTAHVVPRAKPGLKADSDEKTTLESQWEDEASTTVEQGEVQERIRAIGLGVPASASPAASSSNALDEPTVDDQHANPAIVDIPTPSPDAGRLVITQGSDLGRDLEIRPGKPYTIGRGLDNDFVLTDIAVSRKHFDLRYEAGSWIIVDRGSGNGTLVNGNLEDAPFMLANGDQIEIGNTVFRFEQASAPRRAQSYADDEEMSTVAGKPMRGDPLDAATPLEAPAPRIEPLRERPKTLPPPSMMRSGPSAPPYAGLPATTMPMPQMANRPPIGAPGQPTLLVDGGLPAMAPTLPGQVAPRAMGYPQATEIPPHSVHAQMLLIQAQQGRPDPSTAHVAPTPYLPSPPGVQLRQYAQPQLSKRSKMLLVAAGVSAFAAILTIAILKSGGSKPTKQALATGGSGSATAKTTTVEPILQLDPPKQDPPKQDPPKQDPPKQDPPKQDPPKVAQTPPKQDPPKQDPFKVVPKQDPPKQDPPKVAQRQDPPKAVQPPKQDPPKQDPPRTAQAKESPTRPKTTPKVTPAATTQEPKRVATADLESARSKADEAYRAKRFSDAANIMAAAARGASDDEAKKARHRAELYSNFGRAYNTGTAPGMKPVEAFAKLQEAIGYDNALSRAFDGELNQKLAQVAPRAAMQFFAQKDYRDAHLAVIKAEAFGGSNETTKLVRSSLEDKAGSLYSQASKEASSNADDARTKCRTILDMVEASSTYGQKAKKLLSQLAQ